MWIKQPGPITDRILLLGREESCVYLLKGDEYTIVGGGMVYVVPDVIEQLKKFGIDENKITRLLILHTHFDHTGMVATLQKRWKNLKVYASPRGKELLATPDVAAQIRALNEGLISMHKMEERVRQFGVSLDAIRVDATVTGGDRPVWGGVPLEIIDAPGHSSCSIAAYIPEDKALFASDAGGIPYGDMIFASGNANFTKYQQTLERFATYDVSIHLSEHYGGFTGKDGRQFMGRSIAAAKETRAILEESYKRTRDVEKSKKEITDTLTEGAKGYFLPRPVMEMVIGQMLRHIAKVIDGV